MQKMRHQCTPVEGSRLGTPPCSLRVGCCRWSRELKQAAAYSVTEPEAEAAAYSVTEPEAEAAQEAAGKHAAEGKRPGLLAPAASAQCSADLYGRSDRTWAE